MSTIESGLEPPTYDDDLQTELLPLRRRRRLPVLTAALAVALVGGAGVLGGVELQKHLGASPAAAGTGATGSARAGGFGRGAGGFRAFGGGAGAAGGSVTAGQVSVIEGSTLYVTDFGGNTLKVTTAGARVTRTVAASLGAIRPGDTVVVRGTQAKGGTIAAESIALGGAGGTGGATGFGGGGATGFGGGGATGFGGNG